MKRVVILSLLCLLEACSEQATSLRVAITFSTIKLDQVSLTGKLDGKARFTNKRFPSKPGTLKSGDDVVIIFPEADEGKAVQVTAVGMWKAQTVASATGQATITKGEVTELTINLGSVQPKDGGPDAGDGGVDIKGWDGQPDGVKDPDLPVLPDLPKLPDGGCKIGTSFCQGDAIVTCVGTEAGTSQVSKICALGCVLSVPVKCRELVPSNNIPQSFLSSGLDSFTPKTGDKVTINTDTDKITGSSALPATMTAPQSSPGKSIKVMAFREIHIPKGATVQVFGSKPLALVASGFIKIEGVIEAMGGQVEAGPGGGQGATNTLAGQGSGVGANGVYKKHALPPYFTIYITSGGGGGGHGAVGGKGGDGQYSAVTILGGAGGKTNGSLALTPLIGGSGGGRGGTNSTGGGNSGGGGGGAIQIVSRTLISLGSSTGGGGINVSGGGGGASNLTYQGGGGGGSGGGILLEAPTVTIMAGAVLAANGGGGAGGSGSKTGALPGEVGTLSSKLSGYGTPSSNGGNGGYGGAGNTPAGIDGSPKIAAGGGGGGAGIVRINTKSGKATVGGTISGLSSEGKVKAIL